MQETWKTADRIMAKAKPAGIIAEPCATPVVMDKPKLREGGHDSTVPFAERAIADFETELKDWETRGSADGEGG